MSKYGVDHPLKVKRFREDAKKTNMLLHGVEFSSQRPDVKEKMKATCLEKYGVEWANSSATVQATKVKDRDEPIFKDFDKLYSEVSADPEIDLGICYLANKHSFSVSTFYRKCMSNGLDYTKFVASSTSVEEELFYRKLGIEAKRNDRSMLNGKEIDILFAERTLGVEYHGLYWHSRDDTTIDFRHKAKAELAEKSGIKLLQFWSSEVDNKFDIVKSIIESKLGILSDRIFARKCLLRNISSSEHSDFCNRNHLQGAAGASVRLGLFYCDELVAIMSFGKTRFDNRHEWEMIRYCSKLNTNVIGAASKLWKHFVTAYDPQSVVTYADARISDGALYGKLGFTYSHHSAPNHFYTKDCKTLESRIKYQKHRLENILENYDADLSGKTNMINHGFRIVYDAGNKVFTWVR